MGASSGFSWRSPGRRQPCLAACCQKPKMSCKGKTRRKIFFFRTWNWLQEHRKLSKASHYFVAHRFAQEAAETGPRMTRLVPWKCKTGGITARIVLQKEVRFAISCLSSSSTMTSFFSVFSLFSRDAHCTRKLRNVGNQTKDQNHLRFKILNVGLLSSSTCTCLDRLFRVAARWNFRVVS